MIQKNMYDYAFANGLSIPGVYNLAMPHLMYLLFRRTLKNV